MQGSENEARVLELRKERNADAASVGLTPEAWVARIVSLVDAGQRDEAARALVAFRSAYPEADDRLPESLRAWAQTVKR